MCLIVLTGRVLSSDICPILLAYSRMPSVKHGLSIKFGKGSTRIYNSQMLHRFIADEKKRTFGIDAHRIAEFMKRGRQLNKNGGEFEVDLDDTMRIKGTRHQMRRQKWYARQFGSYHCVGDGTFATNKYGLTLFPWCSPDSLDNTILIGSTTSRSENTADVVSGHLFGIGSKPASSEMADNNVRCPAFPTLSFLTSSFCLNATSSCTGSN